MIDESSCPASNSDTKLLPEDFDLALLEPDVDPETGIDLSLIRLNLQKTPWERIVANNDVINFGDGLRDGVARYYAASRQTD
jgi:hypothetical protein